MIIYLDESYDNNKKYFLLGALFNPHHKFLLRKIRQIKTKENFFNSDGSFKEIKYNNCYCEGNFKVGMMMIDSFLNSTSYFRAIVVETSKLNLNKFGKHNESDKIKWARAYKKFAEMLLRYNTAKIYNGVLLTDGLTRCDGDLFIEKMREEFCLENMISTNSFYAPTLKSINDVRSDVESYQVIQLNDILLGCILNNLFPTRNIWKNRLREYLVRKIKVPSLLEDF
ncbi:MAG: DUF3800 domain-containing protein [Actinomycetota bacterium]|nr:DUF3800 domain-containing protein [Actinomycetota bacterium]